MYGLSYYQNSVGRTLSLTESSPLEPIVEPLTLAEVKAYLSLPPVRSPVDLAEDDHINSLIAAARSQAETLSGRDLVRKQYDLTIDDWPYCGITLRAPLVSVDLVTNKDCNGVVTTLVEGTDYLVDIAKMPGVMTPPYNSLWPVFTPWPSSAILIRFTSGYTADSAWWQFDGALLKNGMRRLISDWYNNRLPFEQSMNADSEIPYGVTAALSSGAIRFVR